ncbi:Protein CBG27547 [Caenorhabditis briggsae]|uniref:Protein CBG27547 n=1 Tax=Caenorhabditis briggsae TaxID=6238 RepID=B6IKL1_CAEBR|nr:Protein CBG27547 [Caenorhabditis briggsae]CAS00441.1 Protein CBG27547 [Caenorhabditis briggsae]
METTTEKPKAITGKPKGGFMRNLIAVDSNQSLKLNTEKFEIVQFKNTTEKDYLEFNSSSNSKLIIPK